MTTFARKLKSQGCTWALLGATAVALGTATAPSVAAEETGTQNYVQILSTQEVSYTAIVTRGTDAINTKPWGTAGFQTISSSQTYLGTEVTVTQEQVADNGVTWALISMDGQEIGWIAKTALTPGSYAKVVSTNAVHYPATITRDTDAINTQPWGAKGYQTVASSSAYYGKSVTVSQEKTMDYGVTWALISIDGKELGWIAKDALKAQTYAAIVSEKTVEYSATINRSTDAINKAPWGTKGFQTIASSAAYVGKTVEVTKEQTTDYGVTWAQISLNGEVLGWIAKDALKVQTYAQITKETAAGYDAIVNRDSDAINTAPWGVKGYQTLSSSAAYVGQTVEVTKEQVTDYGVTWALVSLNGKELGWVAKDALSIKTYAKVVSEKAVAYDALISRGTDAINTAPWGTKGYTTVASSAGYVGKTVAVSKEQVTDYGVNWALVTLDGKELGWIAKDALKVQTYAKVVKETAVDYYAIINRGTDAINTAPWGIKGYQTVGSSADYLGKTVKVSKEQVTDYGVTWVLVSLNGKELGWIAKAGLNKVADVVEVRQETVTDVIPFASTIEIDSTKVNTYEAVKQEGVAGITETVYNVTYVNGVKTTSVVASTNVVKEMVAEIIVKGDQPVITYSAEYTANENEVDFPILYIENAELAVGVENIISAGTKGYELVTYKDKLSDGVKVDTVEVSRTEVKAVRQVVEVGTKAIYTSTTRTEYLATPYKKTVVENANKLVSESGIIQVGVNGSMANVYIDSYFRGYLIGSELISSVVTVDAIDEIYEQGVMNVTYETETSEIPFVDTYVANSELEEGVYNVLTEGVVGTKIDTYKVTTVNGVATREFVGTETTVAPVNKVIEYGTKVKENSSVIEVIKENIVAPVNRFERSFEYHYTYSDTQNYGTEGYDLVSYERVYDLSGALVSSVEVSRETLPVVDTIITVGVGNIGRSEDGLFHITDVSGLGHMNDDELNYILADGNYVIDDTYQMETLEVRSLIYKQGLVSNFNTAVSTERTSIDYTPVTTNPNTPKVNTVSFEVDALEAISEKQIANLTLAKIKENPDLYALYMNSYQNLITYTYNAGIANVTLTAYYL